MKNILLTLMIVLLPITFANASVTHSNKLVETVQAPDERPCSFFRLEGVGKWQADPEVNGSPWFSVPTSHNGHDEMVNILITAYVLKLPVHVETTGQAACGQPEVQRVRFHY